METIQPGEQALREKLGIPAEAQHVLIFGESSHWDPNWLYTSVQYFERYVRANLDQALVELQKEPRRIYSVECIFFLKLYWDARPENREQIRALVNDGRLRLTSSGVTTADTLLPRSETILRDLLLGQEWLYANGMQAAPSLAYFPDSFGYAHTLPSLLRAAGFDSTAITRVDGMNFLGCDLDWPWKFPRPGSSAERLLKTEKTLDFIWRDQAGAEVLCHWNAFTYGQGDLLAADGISRVYIVPYYWANTSEGAVRAKIQSYIKQLQPLSRTPYMFCPIGYDFVPPIADLVGLLDRYNTRSYPGSGVWAVNAGLDDYLALVNYQRSRLPVVELDPNPYWTGFYSARPALKARTYQLSERLLLAETLGLQAQPDANLRDTLERAWWTAAVSNHHDYITGTAKDEVVAAEQNPWLDQAIGELDKALAAFPASRPPAEARAAAPAYQLQDGLLRIQSEQLRLELSAASGGCITRCESAQGLALLGAPSNDLVSYADSGGLWRMGHEFPGGKLRETARASQSSARFEVYEQADCLEVRWESQLDGQRLQRRMWLDGEQAGLRFQVEGQAAADHTLTARFETGLQIDELLMDEPGGWVRRPTEKHYQPTFWPLQSFARLSTPGGANTAVFARGMPGAGAYRPGGSFELVAQRNASQETAFGFLNFPGMPVKGHETESTCLEYGVFFPAAGQGTAGMGAQVRATLRIGAAVQPMRARWEDLLRSLCEVRPADVEVLALKPAQRGDGLLLRLFTPAGAGQAICVRPLIFAAGKAALCDARERIIAALEVRDGQVQLTTSGTITSLLLSRE
jgi:hypothetical protein